MNKKHIVTGIGVVLLTTGIIGGIWSGIDAMPTVITNIQKAEESYNKEEVIYTRELDISKLSIDSNISGVAIKKYNGKDIIVERKGNKELSNITINENNKELTIKEEYRDNKKFTESVDDIVRYFVNELYSSHYSDINVYVPDNIDLDIKTNNGSLYISEDIKLNNVNFDTQYGSISLDSECEIKNLDIKSDSNIALQLSEIYSTENINIKSNFVNINDNNFINKDKKIPESVKITTLNDYYDNEGVSINTTQPIAKNLTIDSKTSVNLELPLLDYKFNFDIKALRGIDFNDDNYERYITTPLEKYFKDNDEQEVYDSKGIVYSQKELLGVINEDIKGNLEEYNINIKSAIVIFN